MLFIRKFTLYSSEFYYFDGFIFYALLLSSIIVVTRLISVILSFSVLESKIFLISCIIEAFMSISFLTYILFVKEFSFKDSNNIINYAYLYGDETNQSNSILYPIYEASLFSRISFCWFNSAFGCKYKKEIFDSWRLHEIHASQNVSRKMEERVLKKMYCEICPFFKIFWL